MAKTVENKTIGQRFFTKVRVNDVVYGGKKFVLGKIEGFKELICDYDFVSEGGKKAMYPIHRDSENNTVFETICTPEKYESFTKLVELHYPGLCVFDCEYNPKKVK